MHCNVGSYVHTTIHSHAPNNDDKVYYDFELTKISKKINK